MIPTITDSIFMHGQKAGLSAIKLSEISTNFKVGSGYLNVASSPGSPLNARERNIENMGAACWVRG